MVPAHTAPCDARRVEACQNNPAWVKFAVCSQEQRAAGLRVAQQLRGGAALGVAPCDLWPYLRGRTLWLLGDSHSKQLFKALQCFLIDFWDGRECKASGDDNLVKQLDALPLRPGESRCIHLFGNGRVCFVHVVLGTSLLNNPQVASNGVLTLLRERGLASRADIFVPQFGVWHAKQGDAGLQQHRRALQTLGEDFKRNGAQWPHMVFRESPMTHDKDVQSKTCLPAAAGWIYDAATGTVSLSPAARSDKAALITRGGPINSIAREVLPGYGLAMMRGFDLSVPLHASHVGARGVAELDCLHYCQHGLPEILVYELTRLIKSGAAGIQQLPFAPPQQRLVCSPI
ncbi:hypothetical protein MNEG_9339 [Monoraphidium neglectum]|uniref:Uncharacterized protein n=1 Tax=Monoraphidium neglectum TaxID=145388 RepID=A0A0D2MCV3_9CHLO|nr:hypothetical protein MNEG_9339 [Monoraphidium neglectum]KIY98626.1 hypothetical protein MNEG_9339 [Monoraphidium neglectum]|eukprot:XP_013897646.1 hypothetical protein MNEG_9339 [Monoraphidium neglectum]